jgi:hypothetical protein
MDILPMVIGKILAITMSIDFVHYDILDDKVKVDIDCKKVKV